mgnify:CR=1 FL=1
MNEPFKVGDKITTDDPPFSQLPWTINYIEPWSDTDAAHVSRAADGTIRCGGISLARWRIHVPGPERKRWTFQTERRVPTADEIYVVGSNVYHFCYQGKGDMMTQEFDVLVAGSVKPLPEEKP